MKTYLVEVYEVHLAKVYLSAKDKADAKKRVLAGDYEDRIDTNYLEILRTHGDDGIASVEEVEINSDDR